jgi:hypothetical protein
MVVNNDEVIPEYSTEENIVAVNEPINIDLLLEIKEIDSIVLEFFDGFFSPISIMGAEFFSFFSVILLNRTASWLYLFPISINLWRNSIYWVCPFDNFYV